jgi:hypothetical protein
MSYKLFIGRRDAAWFRQLKGHIENQYLIFVIADSILLILPYEAVMRHKPPI